MPHSCKVPSKGVVHDFGVGRVTAVTAFGRHGVCCRATRSASHRRLSGSSPQVAGRRFPSRSGRLTGPVSPNGTAVYDAVADLLALVARAVNLARHEGFAHSCRPEHGRLLFALAAGAEVSRSDRRDRDRLRGGPGLAGVGRTPRGPAGQRRTGRRAAQAAQLFSGAPQVTVIAGDWLEIHPHGRFDLLVLDGGAHGKASPPGGRPGRPAPAGRHPGHRRPHPGPGLAAPVRWRSR